MSDSCCSCGHGELRSVREYRTNTTHGRALFKGTALTECGRCRLVQVAPLPSPKAVEEYYQADYRQKGLYGLNVADLTDFPRDNLFFFNRGRSAADLIAPHVSKDAPRILDIGAGYGHILHALGERFPGSTRRAVELSEKCLPHLRSMGIEVRTDPIEEVLPSIEEPLDIISISHVLEHLLDPRHALGLIRDALAPDGVLFIDVPNIPEDHLLTYPDHKWAPRWDEPHVTFFSRGVLDELVADTGFETLHCDTAGPEYRLVSGLRFKMPPMREFVESFIPKGFFLWLRRQQVTGPLRVQEIEPEFDQHGGFRIWIRGVFRKRTDAAAS